MPQDIRETKKELELFRLMGDLQNPTADLFSTLFARHKDSPPKYHPDDLIEIGPEQSPFVVSKSTTTIGIYIVNKFLLEPIQVLGYINTEFTGKKWGKVEDRVAEALLAGDVKQSTVCEFIDRCQYLLGGPLAHLINPSITEAITELPPSAAALKKKLMAEHAAEIAADDPLATAKIEKEVTKEALDRMQATNDPGLCMFESGAIDPYNNYKTMFVMKGAIKDPTGESPTGYRVVASDYDNGLAKDDIPKIANALVNSSYSSGVATQDSGYIGKKYNAVLQSVKIGPVGSDCGSTKTMDVTIDDRYLYRYIMISGKPVLITPDNLAKYKGTVCKLRTPLHCHRKNPEYCNICVGDRPYRIGVHNTGLTFNIMSGATLNASLKAKHDATVKGYTVTTDDLLKYIK